MHVADSKAPFYRSGAPATPVAINGMEIDGQDAELREEIDADEVFGECKGAGGWQLLFRRPTDL